MTKNFTTPSTPLDAKLVEVTLKGSILTRDDILMAIAAYEQDRPGLLAQGKFSDRGRYQLRHDGRSYPSKAILGTAAGLNSKQFSGGIAHTVALLGKLGFHCRDAVTGVVIDPNMEGLRLRLIAGGLEVGELPWPSMPITPLAYFASGSNQPGEIRGLAAAGADIGVATPNLSRNGEAELAALAGTDVAVFIDSGAFSEVDKQLVVVKPMGEPEWEKVLSLYERLGEALGEQLWIVAPDRVGCQETSLERLRQYAPRLQALAALGVNILVPIQKGVLSQSDFHRAATVCLGFSSWFPALPCKKGATTAAECASFVAETKPEHVHLLGLGIRSKKLESFLAPFAADCTVSLDSCWLTGNSGNTNGRANHPCEVPGGQRVFTKARRAVESLLDLAGGLAVIELATYACQFPAVY